MTDINRGNDFQFRVDICSASTKQSDLVTTNVEIEIPNGNGLTFVGKVEKCQIPGRFFDFLESQLSPKKINATLRAAIIGNNPVSLKKRCASFYVTIHVPDNEPYEDVKLNFSSSSSSSSSSSNSGDTEPAILKVRSRLAKGKVHFFCEDENGQNILVRSQEGNYNENVVFPDIEIPNFQLVFKPSLALVYTDSDQTVVYKYQKIGKLEVKECHIPVFLDFKKVPISYNTDVERCAVDEKGSNSCGSINIEDTREGTGKGYKLKVHQDNTLLTGTEISIKTGDCISLLSRKSIPGGNQTIKLVPNSVVEVFEIPQGKAKGEIKLNITNFILHVSKSARKRCETFQTSMTWILADSP